LKTQGGQPPFSTISTTFRGKITLHSKIRMELLRKDVDLAELDVKKLTNDCKLVRRANGTIDLVRSYSSVKVFDHYWDQGIRILKIWHAGGTRNPRFQNPEL